MMRLFCRPRLMTTMFTAGSPTPTTDTKIRKLFCANFQIIAWAVNKLIPFKGEGCYMFMDEMHAKHDFLQSENMLQAFVGSKMCGATCWLTAFFLRKHGVKASLRGTRDHVYLMYEDRRNGEEKSTKKVLDPTYKQLYLALPDRNKSTIYAWPPLYIGDENELFNKDLPAMVNASLDHLSPEKYRISMEKHVASLTQKYNPGHGSLFELNLTELIADPDNKSSCPIIASVVDELRAIEQQESPDNGLIAR